MGYDVAFSLVSIMLAVSGIMIGIGIAIEDRKLKELGKSELYQAVINGVIVGFLFFAFSPSGMITALANSMVQNPAGIPCGAIPANNYAICFAHQFLVGLTPVSINNQSYPTLMMSTLSVLMPSALLYSTLSFVASMQINMVIVSISFSTILQPILNILNYIISTLSITVASLVIQDMLLKFIAMTALSTLLPVGIVLRTFYFTRRLGGAILAITIALFAVFPLTYMLDAQLVANYSVTSSGAINSLVQNSTSLKASVTGTLLGSNLTKSSVNSISDQISRFLEDAGKSLMGFADTLAMVIVEAFFLPVFSIMLTVVSARELARIFGSEISFGRFDLF